MTIQSSSTGKGATPTVEISAAAVGKILALTTTLVIAAHVCLQTVKYSTGHDFVFGLTPFFDLWGENTFPAWYSSLLFATAGLALSLTWLHHRSLGSKEKWYWLALAVIFAFLSLDEAVSLHEKLSEPIRRTFDTSGIFYLAWVIPYGAAVAVIGSVFFRFWWGLPRRTRSRVFFSACVFLAGALGVESVSAIHFEQVELQRTLWMDIANLLEESMEMIGLTFFIYSILWYFAHEMPLCRSAESGRRVSGSRFGITG